MANDKFYGYNPKKEKPLKTQGQIYSGAEKSTRKGQVTHGTYANIGNRLDRVNPYEFRKGMDYELTQMGVSRLAESTVEEREKATESVLKNLESKHPAYYSALIQFERGMSQGGQIKETTFNKFLETYSRGHGDGMMSVEKEFKDDKMVELKESIKDQIRKKLLSEWKISEQKEDEEDEDITDKKSKTRAKKAAKGMARFEQEMDAIKALLYGQDKQGNIGTEDEPMKGSLIALKDKHLDVYKADKDIEKYKKAITLPDAIIKKLEKHTEKFGQTEKGLGNKVTLDDIKGDNIPATIKKLEARMSDIKKEEEEFLLEKNNEKNEIASTDMTRANHLRLLEIIRSHGISLREGKDSVKIYYEIAKQAYLEGLSKGLKL